MSKSITLNEENFDFPACWSHQTQGTCCHVSLCQASRSMSFFLEHLIMTNSIWSQKQVDATLNFLCWSTGRAQLKEQHDSSAAGLIEGPAAEVELNLGSGIKLDRRWIICLGNSREGKNGIRDFAWKFWHLGGGIWKKPSYFGPYASRSGTLAVRHSPWGGYRSPRGWLVSSLSAGADWSSCHGPLCDRAGGGLQGKILMVLVVKEKCCASHFSGPADTINMVPALILSRIMAGFLSSDWSLLGLHIAPVHWMRLFFAIKSSEGTPAV